MHAQDFLAPTHIRTAHQTGVKRPGEAAPDREHSGRFVAAIRMTPSFDSKPSISTPKAAGSSLFALVVPPPRPHPGGVPQRQFSSMKMMQGAFFLPFRTGPGHASATPTNISTSRAGYRKEGPFASPATAASQQVCRFPRSDQQHSLRPAPISELLRLAQELR